MRIAQEEIFGPVLTVIPFDTEEEAVRILDGQELTVILNWTDRTVGCSLAEEAGGEELISNYPTHQPGRLQPYEARVLLRK